jgi:predicted transcriptional regulator
MLWRWSGDVERVLALLPAPLFRPRDIYDVAAKLGLDGSEANRMWRTLLEQGRIVRTATPIGNAKRRFYWERTRGATA